MLGFSPSRDLLNLTNVSKLLSFNGSGKNALASSNEYCLSESILVALSPTK